LLHRIPPRGVGNDPEIRIGDTTGRFVTGTIGLLAGPGLHVPLGPIDVTAGRNVEFSFPPQFMDPVNVYRKAERAVKYGILFVALTLRPGDEGSR